MLSRWWSWECAVTAAALDEALHASQTRAGEREHEFVHGSSCDKISLALAAADSLRGSRFVKLQLISYAALAAALPIHPAFAQAQPLASASDTAGGSAGSADASGKPTPGNA